MKTLLFFYSPHHTSEQSVFLYVTEFTEVALLRSRPAGLIEESDPRHDRDQLIQLLLLVVLQQNHEGPQFSGRKDTVEGSWSTETTETTGVSQVGPRSCDSSKLHPLLLIK